MSLIGALLPEAMVFMSPDEHAEAQSNPYLDKHQTRFAGIGIFRPCMSHVPSALMERRHAATSEIIEEWL
ncbi:hypothetical protein PGTUg99_024790 [Puccinia graminis f. sp. tritici]|uniref:Uncharacterized protein n=1 Tax=Puccinia graminis f. sp. tritici TaxID=56615 RepID=A0A5B0RSG6_PUCGR|nr:hypothetical protein PGTUg99_024790 [Puccinia graminis f. sp. tritici]